MSLASAASTALLADIFPRGGDPRASHSTVVHRAEGDEDGDGKGDDTPPLLSGAATPQGEAEPRVLPFDFRVLLRQ